MFSKEYKTAQRFFDYAKMLSPEDLALRNGLALALCEQDEAATKAKALTVSEANVRQYPNNAAAAITHARVLYRLGRIEEADMVVRQVHTANADLSPDMAYYVACIAADRGRKEEAAEMIRRVLDKGRNAGMTEWPGNMVKESVAPACETVSGPEARRTPTGRHGDRRLAKHVQAFQL